jgi:hypothetical protein
LTESFLHIWGIMGFVTMLQLHITLRQVARQRRRISKSRIFYRRRLMRWEVLTVIKLQI